MSYCRFSCDDFQCDLYVYEDCYGGWTVHVARLRMVYTGALPPAVPLRKDLIPQYMARHQAMIEMMELSDHVPVGLKHDGCTFNFPTIEETVEFLRECQELGYRFPDHVIPALIEEDMENKS